MTSAQKGLAPRPSTAPEEPVRRDDTGRAAHRAVGAAIVAGGLALSVTIHPLLTGPRPIDLLTPDREPSSEVSKVMEPRFIEAAALNFSTLELPDLVKMVEFREQHLNITTVDLVGLINSTAI